MLNKKTVAIIGLGYVGLPLALLADRKGYSVIGIDADKRRIKLISQKISPFVDQEVTSQLQNSNLQLSSDPTLISKVQTIVVCVPTPVDECCIPDLTPVLAASKSIAANLVKGQLVILESTINPGVCDEEVIPLIEKVSGKKCGQDFFLAHCPERINPGDPKWNVSNIARVVGGHDKESLKRAVAFYEDIIDAAIRPMGSLKEAEAVKVVENSFRDVNIAFVNELAMSFTKLGINVVNVIDGAATKPFSFMPHYPGAGVGGHCIPVDPYYLIEYAKRNGFNHTFLSAARGINRGMPAFTVDLLESELAELGMKIKGSKIAVLGLSYKPNVGDLRESPSIVILSQLEARGANIAVHDPYFTGYKDYQTSFNPRRDPAMFESAKDMDASDLYGLFLDADAVLIATAHRQYKDLSADDFSQAGVKVVIDGRNILDKDSFEATPVRYRGIGR